MKRIFLTIANSAQISQSFYRDPLISTILLRIILIHLILVSGMPIPMQKFNSLVLRVSTKHTRSPI